MLGVRSLPWAGVLTPLLLPLALATSSPSTRVAVHLSTGATHTLPLEDSEDTKERTLVLVKPDGVQRGLVGGILSRFEHRGFRIAGLKVVHVSRALAEAHYAEHQHRSFFEGVVTRLVSSPVVAMVLEGHAAVGAVRAMVGHTDPSQAAPGTVRGDLGMSVEQNVVHAADCLDAAEREIGLWFAEDVLV